MEVPNCLLEGLYHWIIPLKMYENFSCSLFSSAHGTVSFLFCFVLFWRWYLIMVLIFIFLVANDIKHLYMFLFVFYIFSLVRYLFVFCPFFNGVFFSYCSILRVFHIVWVQVLCCICNLKIFFPSLQLIFSSF